MSNDFDWKKFQFITEVQTAMIHNAINKSLESDILRNRHLVSATGSLITMDDAFYAAERIPANMTAHEAACEFVEFNCKIHQEVDTTVPCWFQRYK